MDISPDKQTIDSIFSKDVVYHIDFYQRDYKWSSVPVQRLLDDVFYQFGEEYKKHAHVGASKEIVTACYPWYYLNTYVTNTTEEGVYVVDGQQRLTTLTLILIKLRHLAKHYGSERSQWLESKIVGHSSMGPVFWMNHTRYLDVLNSLFEGREDIKSIDDSAGITATNMINNYLLINQWLDKRLDSKHKLETFVFYFLYRLVMINLSVEQTDAPMVFEIFNDRGVPLKPFEILKGKLLGQINKIELDQGNYNGIWEGQTEKINGFHEDEVDHFFRSWLKAKYADSRKEGQRFEGDYHREMFTEKMNNLLKLDHNPLGVKTFLKKTFSYYTSLYARILKGTQTLDDKYPCVHYNSLNGFYTQFFLIMAACKLNDPEEEAKIALVSHQLDRFYTLLQLQNSYNNNRVHTDLFLVAKKIRDCELDEIEPVFGQHLKVSLEQRHSGIVSEPFQWKYFRNTSIITLDKEFIRYYFARIDSWLADGMKVGPKHTVQELVSSGTKTDFHIEHILSNNKDNLALYDNLAPHGKDEDFEQDRNRLFEQDRNRLGGVLLLKGRDNISSSNEAYTDKLKTYSNTLYWNETLRADFYKSNIDFKEFQSKNDLKFRSLDNFGPKEVESRHRLLFKLSILIWNGRPNS